MASYRGKFRYSTGSGSSQGNCQIQFDAQNFTLTPESGSPLVFDLGDIDAVNAADYEIQLPLFTGNTIKLQQFGKAYQDLSNALLENYRKRVLQCLLLEDLQEIDRFTGAFTLETAGVPPASGPAEVRLFKSNLAVLPTTSQAFQWRLSDVEQLGFDSQNYEVILQSGSGKLRINRLAKRTELFHTRLRDAIDALHAESGEALHAILPFLDPDQVQSASGILREGHSAAIAKLRAIDPKIPDALTSNAVDKGLKPYYDYLVSRTAKDLQFAGFKLIRPEDSDLLGGDGDGDEADQDGTHSAGTMPGTDPDAPEALYWFFFPIASKTDAAEPGNVVAWEASSRSGRATYFFRLVEPANENTLRDAHKSAQVVEDAVNRLNRVLGLLNFRRRPIFLSDKELAEDPAFHRYAIAARRIPDLRQVRAAFLGRAVHSSIDAWRTQVDNLLAKAGL